jgi:hypothetical protein
MGCVQLASQFPSGSDSESSREEGEIHLPDARSFSPLPHESVFNDLRTGDVASVRRQIPLIARDMKRNMEQVDRTLRTCGFHCKPVCVSATVFHRFFLLR